MATVITGTSAETSAAGGTKRKTYKFAFGMISSLFFIFGFITCLNDILVPHLKSLFTLNYTRAALIQFCFFTAYFVASLPAGKIVAKKGYKNGIIIGLMVTAVGCLLFVPAASMQSYAYFLVGLFILACGITLIQVASNPFITVLGPEETASSRLTLAQAFNSFGTTLAPLFGSYLILSVAIKSQSEFLSMDAASQIAYKATQASTVQGPYIGLAAVLVLLAAGVWFAHLPHISGAGVVDDEHGNASGAEHDLPSAWKYKHLILGALGIFCYVGAEVAIGSYLVNFIGLPEITGFAESSAAKYVSLYWGGAMVGRFIGAVVLRKFSPGKILAFNAFTAVILIALAMCFDGQFAMWAILSIGLFNSIMFPTIFSLSIFGLGKNTEQGSGILCMAIVGGAIIPMMQGQVADWIGLHHSYVLPVLCYLYIAYFGLTAGRHAQTALATAKAKFAKR